MHQTSLPRLRHTLAALMLGLTICSFIPLRRAQAAAAGALDVTFGNSGKVTTSFGSLDVITGIAIQPDGKILAAGYGVSPGPEVDFAIVRYTTTGSLDLSFGTGGRVTTDFPGQSLANGIALQPDGKFIVVGFVTNGNSGDNVLVRYNANGSLDSTFGVGGIASHPLGNLGAISRIAIQSDGKIIAGGGSSNPSGLLVARLDSDGSLDTSFGTAGVGIAVFPQPSSLVTAMALQPDGKIVIIGDVGPGFAGSDFGLARFNGDGSPDSTFGVGGKTSIDFSGQPDLTKGLALQPDGKIVVAGDTINPTVLNGSDMALARVNSNGSLDSTFGSGGKVVLDFSAQMDEAFAVAVQPDGKIVAAGSTGDAHNPNFALARLNSDGSLDAQFGSGGKVSTDFFGSIDQAYAIAIQADGKIVAAGTALTAGIGYDFALARYNASATVLDACIQDDSNRNLLQYNAVTGEYQFTNCSGVAIGGAGIVTRQGNLITLQDNVGDRRVLARIDLGKHRATASVQSLATGKSFTIIDRNTTNNTCGCK